MDRGPHPEPQGVVSGVRWRSALLVLAAVAAFLLGAVGVIYAVLWAFLWPLTVLVRIVGAA